MGFQDQKVKKLYNYRYLSSGCITPLGYFHLVGKIFTLWGKIYPSKDKMKWAAFRTMTGLYFLGNSDTMIYFQEEPQFSSKMKKLKSWWLIANFSNCKG